MNTSAIIWQNIPRVFTALAEWLSCVGVIFMLIRHRPPIIQIVSLVVCLPIQVLLQLWCGTWPLSLWILGIILNIIWMMFTIWVVVPDCGRRRLLYALCRAFVMSEMAAAVVWQLVCMTVLQITNSRLAVDLTVLVGFAIIFTALCFVQRHYTITDISLREDAVAVLIAMIIFAISNVGFITAEAPMVLGGYVVAFTIRSFVDVCGMLMLSIQDKQRAVRSLENDLTNMNKMMDMQYQQYQEYKQSSELVNQHFHDLKHQLTVLALEDDSQKRQEYLNEISEDIHMYNVGVKTGNKIADVILTRKNAYFKQHHITFTCIANGALLNMIDTMDLCSLLGNSLDNATESVEKIADPQKRLIDLRIVKKGSFVLYQVENYTLNHQSFTDLPKITKKNKALHGYGLKSIRRIAAKYGGTMTVNEKNHWFRLTILFTQTDKPAN